MTWAFRAAAGAVALVLLLGAASCGTVPSAPSAPDWRSTARQSLQSAASETATMRMVLEQEQEKRLLGRYAAVAATNAEDALGSAQDSILTQQPPAGSRPEFDEVSQLLGDAADLVTEARIALVADARSEYADLVDRLDRTTSRLDDLRRSLRGAK